MKKAEKIKGRTRRLYEWEIQEARRVFGDRVPYARVRIHENARWTDAVDRFGRWLKRMKPLEHSHNALTLGYHVFFPVMLPETRPRVGDATDYMPGWLIHELTHVWQYERVGWGYLARALKAQFRLGAAAYDIGGIENLLKRRESGWTLHSFNMEQEGAIVQSYYDRMRRGQDVTALIPFIEDIQTLDTRTRHKV